MKRWSIFDEENSELLESVKKRLELTPERVKQMHAESSTARDAFNQARSKQDEPNTDVLPSRITINHTPKNVKASFQSRFGALDKTQIVKAFQQLDRENMHVVFVTVQTLTDGKPVILFVEKAKGSVRTAEVRKDRIVNIETLKTDGFYLVKALEFEEKPDLRRRFNNVRRFIAGKINKPKFQIEGQCDLENLKSYSEH
jgi:hypothetical protein